METDGHVEKQSTVFPHVLAKRLGAFCTVPTGFTAVNPQTTKPDISLATKTGHFYLLPTVQSRSVSNLDLSTVWLLKPVLRGSRRGETRLPVQCRPEGLR